MGRSTYPQNLKTAVYERDGGRCRYCGKTDPEMQYDHVYPLSKGGETSVSNLVLACRNCNKHKYNQIGIWPKPIGYYTKRRISRSTNVGWLIAAIGAGSSIFAIYPQPLGISSIIPLIVAILLVSCGLGYQFGYREAISLEEINDGERLYKTET